MNEFDNLLVLWTGTLLHRPQVVHLHVMLVVMMLLLVLVVLARRMKHGLWQAINKGRGQGIRMSKSRWVFGNDNKYLISGQSSDFLPKSRNVS